MRIFLAAGLALHLSNQPALAQKNAPESKALAEIEKSIERGLPAAADERRLIDLAVANPNDARALELLARLRLRQGRLAESRALYQRVLKIDPNSVRARINGSRVALALGQRDEAKQILSAISQAGSLAPATKLELGAALLLVGEAQSALKITESLPLGLRNTDALPLRAALYLEAGRRNELAGLIPLMKKVAPASPAIAVRCAEVLREARLYNEGIAVLSLALGTRSDVEVLVPLAKLEIATRDLTKAREHLRRAAALKPDSVDVLSARAFLESETDNVAEALKLMTRARELAPDSTSVLADFVAVAMRAGKPVLAVDGAKALVAMEPGNPEFEYLFGAASLQGGDLDSAHHALENFVQKRPLDSRGCLALGMTYAGRRDQTDKARKQLAHCIEIDPSNVEARYQLGLSFKSEGEIKQAIKFLEEATAQAPGYALALRDLGALYLESGEHVKARQVLERAVALIPQDADTHFQLARLYNQLGESALAKQHRDIFQKLRGPWGKQTQ